MVQHAQLGSVSTPTGCVEKGPNIFTSEYVGGGRVSALKVHLALRLGHSLLHDMIRGIIT